MFWGLCGGHRALSPDHFYHITMIKSVIILAQKYIKIEVKILVILVLVDIVIVVWSNPYITSMILDVF